MTASHEALQAAPSRGTPEHGSRPCSFPFWFRSLSSCRSSGWVMPRDTTFNTTSRRGWMLPDNGSTEFLSAMDGVGELRLRRAALHFLPAAFLDAGRSARTYRRLESRAHRFYRARANVRGSCGVCAGAEVDVAPRRFFLRALLRRKSIRPAKHIHAERFRRVAC